MSSQISHPGVDLASSQERFELDILALTRTTLVVGEVKARASAYTKEEVTRLRRHATTLGSGLVILASFDEWKSDSRERVVGLLEGVNHSIWGRSDLLAAN